MYVSLCVPIAKSCPTMQSHGLQPTRLLCPWNFPGKNTEVGCHFLLQGIFLTQGLIPCVLHLLRWQEDSLPLSNLGNPINVCCFKKNWPSPLLITWPEFSLWPIRQFREQQPEYIGRCPFSAQNPPLALHSPGVKAKVFTVVDKSVHIPQGLPRLLLFISLQPHSISNCPQTSQTCSLPVT